MKYSHTESGGDAYGQKVLPSCTSGIMVSRPSLKFSAIFMHTLLAAAILAFGAGCGSSTTTQPTAATPAEPAIPEDVQSAANAFLGKETTVLAFGDLAKNGAMQMLAANVVPKTPKNTLPGTIVTRAVIAESTDGKWRELVRCDEHLKNEKGYLGMSPIQPVAGWRVQFEKDPAVGLQLYLTPVKGNDDPHVLPLAVRWNTETKRYQSLDRNYEHFLPEAAALHPMRSQLR